jgi:glycosyltransferase involved in cell wall biosynthesis
MKIGIMGTRGIPASYGGFETFAEKLSIGLAEKGHDVTVFCRSNNINYNNKYYNGVQLVILPTIQHKYLDTVAHTFLSVLYSLFNRYDVILICNSVNSLFSFVPRLTGQKVAINVDGLEWQRAKWNKIGKVVYRISELLATILPNYVVTDSMYIKKYYATKFKKRTTFIPYGAPTQRVPANDFIKKYNLSKRAYILYVSRLEPENNAHLVVKAFEKTETDMNLVVVGDAPYNSRYIEKLKQTRDPRIIFTGYVFGRGYQELQSHAYFYVQATEVGGTHPALLEAMGYGNCVLANDVPEHKEVLGKAGIMFSTRKTNDLSDKMNFLISNPDVVDRHRQLCRERILENYTWNRIIKQYESLFLKMMRINKN